MCYCFYLKLNLIEQTSSTLKLNNNYINLKNIIYIQIVFDKIMVDNLKK